MPRSTRAAMLPLLLVAALAGCTAPTGELTPTATATPTANSADNDAPRTEMSAGIASVVESAMEDLHLKAVVVEVRIGEETVISEAFGESMTAVPATTDMHFRNGAVAFSYISNLLLQYVDDGTLSLDDTIDEWVPELPESDRVTLLMLANQTTGYPDFEQNADWLAAYNADPFHLFTYEERIDYAFSTPLQFEPGTNWSYAHTNFMILGHILEKVAGRPLDEQIQDKVLTPMGLTETAAYTTSFIPEPVLHAFSSERRQALGVPAGAAFTEESSFWNPAWGTPIGLAQTDDDLRYGDDRDRDRHRRAAQRRELPRHDRLEAHRLRGEAPELRAFVFHAGRRLQLWPRRGSIGRMDAAEPASERVQRRRGIPAIGGDLDRGREHVRTRSVRLQRHL